VPGTGAPIQNNQCIIYGPGSALVSAAGTDIVLNLRAQLLGTYAGATKNAYFIAQDTSNLDSGRIQTSTWANVQQAPSIISATPSNAAGTTQTFTVTARDLNGFGDINRVYFQVHTAPSVPTGTCHGFYDRPSGYLYLYNDALTSLSAPLAIGTAGSIQNSQCIVYGVGSSVISSAGSDLIFNLQIGRQGSYATGNKNMYFISQDSANQDSGWVQTGNWTP
jgi:hypothetical protein